MAVQSISIDQFLKLAERHPILDVRSPVEYAHAHIPDAHSLPLFTDEERKEIGTTYKQVSREDAIKTGLDAFGPKMRRMVEETERLLKGRDTVLVHCWRGGMRSLAVAWLLDFYGFQVYLLEGGYKAYRHWVIGHWANPGPLRILAGYTGARKTPVLNALDILGEPVIDLEGLASHKGSAFGGLDGIPQPTQEMFENLLAGRLSALRKKFGQRAVWMEDESQRIGNLNIPHVLFAQMREAPHVFLYVPFETRLSNITEEYGSYPTDKLINAIIRIKKRLGPLETKTAILHLLEGGLSECFGTLLHYYDKLYYPAQNADGFSINGVGRTPTEIAAVIKEQYP